jgi:hypothetical protein
MSRSRFRVQCLDSCSFRNQISHFFACFELLEARLTSSVCTLQVGACLSPPLLPVIADSFVPRSRPAPLGSIVAPSLLSKSATTATHTPRPLIFRADSRPHDDGRLRIHRSRRRRRLDRLLVSSGVTRGQLVRGGWRQVGAPVRQVDRGRRGAADRPQTQTHASHHLTVSHTTSHTHTRRTQAFSPHGTTCELAAAIFADQRDRTEQ